MLARFRRCSLRAFAFAHTYICVRVACTRMSARRRMRRRSGAANPTCSRRANADHDIRWPPCGPFGPPPLFRFAARAANPRTTRVHCRPETPKRGPYGPEPAGSNQSETGPARFLPGQSPVEPST
ncbi:hypothetical protein LG3211_1339 [Lysobacter gummosus]|nr:hypothetical protein LG3211_1339 [Lysobacter gummosus]